MIDWIEKNETSKLILATVILVVVIPGFAGVAFKIFRTFAGF